MKKVSKLSGKSLQASTLVELIVASVIFMVVFLMGMYTLTRLMGHGVGDTNYLVMESELQRLRKEINLRQPVLSTQSYSYEWGEVYIQIVPYTNHVYRIELTGLSKKKHRTITYRFLQAVP